MKKFLSLFILINLINSINFVPPNVLAATSTGSATNLKAQDLLDRVATKVATLTSKLRRVYIGKIKSTGTASYTVTTPDGDRTITTNDVTNFFRIRGGSRSEINFSALKVGDDIAAIGTVDPKTFEMTAKQIIAKIKRYNVVGKISAIDKTIYSVTEISGKATKVDLSDAIALKMINSKGQIVTAKMENFKEGDYIFAITYVSDPSSETLSALKAVDATK